MLSFMKLSRLKLSTLSVVTGVFTLALGAQPAFGACGQPFDAQDLLASYQTVQFMMASGDADAAVDAGTDLEAGLACLTALVPPALFAGVYRSLGATHAFAEEEAEATKWFLIARQLDNTSTFGVDELAFDSPVRALFDAAGSESAIAPVRVPGKSLLTPENSMILLDGVEIHEAAATPNRYHSLQLAHLDGRIRRTWIIEGNAFPAILLQEGVEEEEQTVAIEEGSGQEGLTVLHDQEGMPAGYDVDDFVRLSRDRPPLKTPSMMAGGATLAGSLILYGASFYTQSRFGSATTEDELFRYQKLTNRLTVGASSLFVLGGAAGSWGVMMNGGPGLGFHHTW
jgi:hypothetical protein